MQNYCKTIGALAAASALVAGTASAEVEYEIHTGYTSEYLFRGQTIGQDLVEVGVDVAAEYRGFGVSAGAWYASFDEPTGFGAPFQNSNAAELNLYGELSYDLGFVEAAVGYIYYYYPQGQLNQNLLGHYHPDQEVYFSLSREFFGFEASLTYFWDVKGDNDGYSEAFLGKGFVINECLTLSTGVTLGYFFEPSELGHVTAKVALDYAFRENATISPFVAHSWGLRNDAGADYNNELVGGAILAVRF
jgi:hypothetical protein